MLLQKREINIGKILLNNWKLLVSSFLVISLVIGIVFIKTRKIVVDNERYWKDKITSFCINQTCFEYKDNKWWIGAIPANDEMVINLIKRLSHIIFDSVASVNQANFSNFGIDGKTIIRTNNKSLEIGNFNNDVSATFVKIPEDNTVYRTGVMIDKNSLLDTTKWENLKVFDISKDDIKVIRLNGKYKNFAINLSKNKLWVEKLVNLTGVKYLANYSPSGNVYVYEIITKDDKTYKLLVGNNWVTIDNKNYFEINRQTHSWLTGNLK